MALISFYLTSKGGSCLVLSPKLYKVELRSREKNQNPVFWRSIRGKWKSIQGEEVNYQKWVGELNACKVNKYYAQENCEISKDLMHRFVAIVLSIVFLIFGLFFVVLSLFSL